MINIADCVNPDTGKTFREENNAKTHNIPIGTLVEIDFDDSYLEEPKRGLRMFVVEHERDYDGTPLYALSFNKNWRPGMFGKEFAFMERVMIDTGYSEDSLKVVDPIKESRSKEREEDVLKLCEAVLDVSPIYWDNPNGPYETTCPFCDATSYRGGNGLIWESMSELNHNSDCAYLLAKDLSTNLLK